MTDNEFKDLIKFIDEFTKNALTSPELYNNVLVKEGIYHKNGKLTDDYKQR